VLRNISDFAKITTWNESETLTIYSLILYGKLDLRINLRQILLQFL